MARYLLLLIVLATAVHADEPLPAGNDRLTLKDGTVLRGKVITDAGGSVFFEWVDGAGDAHKKVFKPSQVASVRRGAYKPDPRAKKPKPQSNKGTLPVLVPDEQWLIGWCPKDTPAHKARQAVKPLMNRMKRLKYEGIECKAVLVRGHAALGIKAPRWTDRMRSKAWEVAHMSGSPCSVHKICELTASEFDQHGDGKTAPKGKKWASLSIQDKLRSRRVLVETKPMATIEDRTLQSVNSDDDGQGFGFRLKPKLPLRRPTRVVLFAGGLAAEANVWVFDGAGVEATIVYIRSYGAEPLPLMFAIENPLPFDLQRQPPQ